MSNEPIGTSTPPAGAAAPVAAPAAAPVVAAEAQGNADAALPPVMYCANHPETETLLRCNRCDKPICLRCAVQTPVGYRCKECVREHQDVYYNGTASDNLVALGIAFGMATVATPIIGFFLGVTGWLSFLIAFLAGGAAGSALAQIIRSVVKRRRTREMRWFALAGVLLGIVAGSFLAAVIGIGFPLFMIALWIFAALAIASALPFLR